MKNVLSSAIVALAASQLFPDAAQAYSIRLDYTGATYQCLDPQVCGDVAIIGRTGSVTIDMSKLPVTSLANIRIGGGLEGFLGQPDPDIPGDDYSGFQDLTNPAWNFTEVGSYFDFVAFGGIFQWLGFDGDFREGFSIAFDDSGSVSEWELYTYGDSKSAAVSSADGDWEAYHWTAPYGTAWESDEPGTWTTTVIDDPAAVPLPATLPLGAAALAGLALFRRRAARAA